MSFIDCINAKVKNGKIRKDQAERVKRDYEDLKKRYTKTMGDEQAAAISAAQVVESEQFKAAYDKKTKIQAALHQAAIVEKIKKDQKGDFAKGMINLSEQVHIRQQSALKQMLHGMDEVAEQFRSKLGGLTRDVLGITPVIREMLGEATGDAQAAAMAKSVRSAFDYAHGRFRAAGGLIGKLENYYPQMHSAAFIRGVPFEEWRDYLLPRLDLQKMTDLETGLPIGQEKLLKIMEDTYQDIVTNGKHTIQKMADEGKQLPPFSGDVNMRQSANRFFHFKNADAFFEYNERFGSGPDGLYDMMINHLEGMARDIALLEVYGPKPNALARHLDLQIAGSTTGSTKRRFANATYEIVSGRADAVAGENWWFNATAASQNVLRAALLTAAPLSAISDQVFQFMTAKQNGLSGMKVFKRFLKQLNPANSKDRQLARRSAYLADVMRGKAWNEARFAGESMNGGATAWLSGFTNRASGLHAMTNAVKDALAMEMEATIFDMRDLQFADLDKAFREAAEAHGIGAAEWDMIRKSPAWQPEPGVNFITSRSILDGAGEVAAKQRVANLLDDWIFEMRAVATNEPGPRTRAITTGAFFGDARRGTLNRGLMSSFMMLKSFPITVMFMHVLPSIAKARGGNYAPLVAMLVGTTVLGAAAIQLKDLSKGRTARDMDKPNFWLAAMMQGGGMGLFGDFLFADYSRFGRDPLVDMLGPAFGTGSDVLRVFKGNFDRALDDPSGFETERFMRDTFRLVTRNIPSVNFWYSRLVLERAIYDQVERMIDPMYDSNIRRMERRMEKDYGNQFWWGKGELLPEIN